MIARVARPRHERGQTLPLVVVFMAVMLLFAGLVIDVGHAFVLKRQLQTAADLGVLAGAERLPNTAAAETEAGTWVATNYNPGPERDAVTSAVACGAGTAGTRVCVEARSSVATAFLRLLDVTEFDLRVRASAEISTYTGFVNVAPWAVTKAAVDNGTVYEAGFIIRGDKKDSFSSLRGTTSIAINAGCSDSKSNDERDILDRSTPVCELRIGETIKADPGSSTSEVQKGLDKRKGIVPNCSSSCLDTFTRAGAAGGHRQVTNHEHSNLIMIPIIDAWDTKNPMAVRGFVWFAIERWDKDNVYGQAVDPPATMPPGMMCNGVQCSTAPWEAGVGGSKVVRLIA